MTFYHGNYTLTILRQVPKLKQRFAGKTIPPEKYVCVNAEKYFMQNESLPLPAFVSLPCYTFQIYKIYFYFFKDLFYIWNIYNYANNNPDILNPIIKRVDEALLDYAPGKCKKIDQ